MAYTAMADIVMTYVVMAPLTLRRAARARHAVAPRHPVALCIDLVREIAVNRRLLLCATSARRAASMPRPAHDECGRLGLDLP